jgi:hypothetical protein
MISKKNLIRLIVYPLILHFFGLVQLWHKFDHNPELDYYFDWFSLVTQKEVGIRGAITESMFPAFVPPWSPKGSEIIGMCHPLVLSDLSQEVQFNARYWDSASENERFLLVFHELGHCRCYLFHDATLLEDGCPASLMSPYLPPQECADAHFLDYAIDIAERCRK